MKSNILSALFPLIKDELNGSVLENSDVTLEGNMGVPVIRISCKTMDDPTRKSKKYQPILITLNEDFDTSEFFQCPFTEISVEFTSFIRNKCTNFIPRTTEHIDQSHASDNWMFPEEC